MTSILSHLSSHSNIVIFDAIKGNILMLSDGRPGVDNFYTLKDGTHKSSVIEIPSLMLLEHSWLVN